MSSSSAMTTFHPFPRLPAELRNAVWELTLDPREVAIKASYQGEGSGEDFHAVVHFSSPTAIPSALQACRDSRYLLASRHYTRAFGNGTTPHYTWIAFALDTIRICDTDLPQLICLPDLLSIRSLTIGCPAHSIHDRFDATFAVCEIALLKLTTLHRASIVCAVEYQPLPTTNATCADKWVDFLHDIQARHPLTLPHNPPRWTMRYANSPKDWSASELLCARAMARIEHSQRRNIRPIDPEARRQFLATIRREDT